MIEAATSQKSLTSIPSKILCLNSISSPFHQKGWALPVKLTFHFKGNQKSLLFKLFVNGENTGSKVSPDAAHEEM